MTLLILHSGKCIHMGEVKIFFDEMDKIAGLESPFTAFLQMQMDGINVNKITIIGATNHPTLIEPALLDRFTCKISLPKLDTPVLNLALRQTLGESIEVYKEKIYFDAPLAAEMNGIPNQLATASEGLSWRSINATIRYFLGDLKREKQVDHVGSTYIRLQDICFAFELMKMQQTFIGNEGTQKVHTLIEYIREHQASFFSAEIPEGSIDTSTIFSLEPGEYQDADATSEAEEKNQETVSLSTEPAHVQPQKSRFEFFSSLWVKKATSEHEGDEDIENGLLMNSSRRNGSS